MGFDAFIEWALLRIFMPVAYIYTIGLAIHIRMTYPEVTIEEGRAMTNCLGLDLVPLENPSEWPIMAKKVLLGLVFIGASAFLGFNFGKMVSEDIVVQIIFSIAAVVILAAAWFRGNNFSPPILIQCSLCGEWVQIDACRNIPYMKGLVCGGCNDCYY